MVECRVSFNLNKPLLSISECLAVQQGVTRYGARSNSFKRRVGA